LSSLKFDELVENKDSNNIVRAVREGLKEIEEMTEEAEEKIHRALN
jgi:hypothetical protein